MWSVGRRATDVYLGSNALAVCSQGDVEVAASCDGVSAALDMLGTWRDAQARRVSIRFWLSGALCRPFTIPVVRGVKTRDELQGIADATASARTGLVGACVSRVEEDKKGRAIGVAVQAERDRFGSAISIEGARGVTVRLRRKRSAENLQHSVS